MTGVELLGGRIGAAVEATADLLHPGEGGTALRDLVVQHKVVVLTAGPVSARRVEAVARALGPPAPVGDPFDPAVPCVGRADGAVRANRWHSDLSFRARPTRFTVLQVEAVPDRGGDTVWGSTEVALERLDPHDLAAVRDRTAHHVDPLGLEDGHHHPVVRAHPDTGRPALYVNRYYTRGLSDPGPQDDALFGRLLEATESVHGTCRWRWTPGDIAVWDNACTVHVGVDDYPEGAPRSALRAVVPGDAPRPGRPAQERSTP